MKMVLTLDGHALLNASRNLSNCVTVSDRIGMIECRTIHIPRAGDVLFFDSHEADLVSVTGSKILATVAR